MFFYIFFLLLIFFFLPFSKNSFTYPKIFISSSFLLYFFIKNLFKKNIKIYFSKPDLFFILFLIYNFFTGIFSKNEIYFSSEFLNIFFLFFFYLFLRNKELNYKKFFKILLLIVSILTILGRFSLIPEFKRFTGTPKPYLPLGNPDYLGSLLIILLPFSFNSITLLILGFFALYLTGSETSYFGITISVLFYFYLKKRKYFITFLLISTSIFLLLFLKNNYTEPLILRSVYYRIGFDIFKENPFGIGLGNLRTFYPVYHLKHLLKFSYNLKIHIPFRLHSDPLQILVEGGLPGFLFFLAFIVSFIKNIDFRKTDLIPLLSLTAIFFQSFLFFPLHRPSILVISFFLLSRIKQKNEKKIEFKISKFLKYFLAAFLFAIYLNYFSIFLSDIYFYKGIKNFEIKNFKNSLKYLNKAYKLYPEPEILFWKARIFFNEGDFISALNTYKKIEKLIPGPYLFYNIGLCYYNLKNHKMAKKYFLSSYIMDKDIKASYNIYKECLRY